ncbi:MBL fold metallo-hydrolase RNA specificity domain-containing protein [Vibrio salinus]|uniref:MBL fold metallo-hydrolase RNA specificity domain-containing protein n=1 Tax=Vibrio salinus TaxID=2899784 RepID=UPI001E3D1F46|nr:MBL fold metallo-hydrolase [Vibrio salinus]MCE0493811.1 MBL fold metallo-hydrolase [Vibrio salinus]
MLTIIHHGARHTVTGSCHELKIGKSSLLIDCGLEQGNNAQNPQIDFPIKSVEAVILTHAHIDHVGRLPWLLAAGFVGKVYCTPATAALLPLLLRDSLRIYLGLAEAQIRHILNRLDKQIMTLSYGQWLRIRLPREQSYCYVRFSPAGHILGSAITEIKLADENIVAFSGDIGPSNTPLLPDPVPPKRADFLVLESTYGDKIHEDVEGRATRLEAIIQHSLQDGGAIIIPAFSIGRTQELLFDIENLIHQHAVSDRLPILLDSPMAVEVTHAYRRFRKLWSKEAKHRYEQHRHPLAFEQCITIDGYREHKRVVNRLAASGEPAIVIAASGMCQGGRVMDYLAQLLPDPRTDVIFAGYQAEDTLGCQLQEGESQVYIDGHRIEVKAQIHHMSGYSAHADQADLLRFVERIEQGPGEIRLVHGEENAQSELAGKLKALGYHVS